MKKSAIVFLCNPSQIHRERAGYLEALQSQGYEVIISGDIEYLAPIIKAHSDHVQIIGIIHVEASALLPVDLWDIPIPNLCFQIDTNSDTKRRARSASAFDAAIVFHPRYVERFQQLGVLRTFLLPHAIQKKLFEKSQKVRQFDIGWVGRFDGSNYTYRRKIVQGLQRRYQMNDINRYYTPPEMVDIYQQSKIIVNVGKDDYLQDANLRCFEAMASGALLLTPSPTEIADLGLEEGKHFASFSSEEDLYQKVDYYLRNEEERLQLSRQGQVEVLNNHTYQARAKELIHILAQVQPDGAARNWSINERLQEIAFFKTRWGKMDEAFTYLAKIPSKSPYFYQTLFHITRLFLARVKNAL